MLFFRYLFQVDIFNAQFFTAFVPPIFIFYRLALSSQTEAGSAGEQPARDNLDVVEIK